MNTNFLNDFKLAIVALLAVLNSTNSPVNMAENMPRPLDGPSTEMWPKTVITNLQIPVGTVYQSTSPSNTFVLTSRTNWITDDEIKALVTSGQVCRVVGHVWTTEYLTFGYLTLLDSPHRYCALCGKVETQKIGEWK